MIFLKNKAGKAAMIIMILLAALSAVILIMTKEGWKSPSDRQNVLADGDYIPDSFSFSGGSGKVNITCTKITVSDGRSYATLEFDSPYYTYVKVDGCQYNTEISGDTALVTIPVQLNTENTISGMTTKMSSPHEVTYIIFPCLSDGSTAIDSDCAEAFGASDHLQEEDHLQDNVTDEYDQVNDTEELSENRSSAGTLNCTGQMKLQYAECFDIYYYEGGYKLIATQDGNRYLTIPEGASVPEGLEEDIKLLYQPLDRIYLAATSAMALFNAVDGLDNIRLSGTAAGSWYIEAASEAMERGDILFAGKYSEPDYELLVDEECDLAVESMMIFKSPKVQEMLEMLDIPVFVDCSSKETHPLGREEWVRLYGAMLDKEDEADAFFSSQAAAVEEIAGLPNTEKTVAFFYISTDGLANVRKSTDYVPGMIQLGGGRYIFKDLEGDGDSQRTTVSMSMEDFYAAAVNADYIVYNASIDNPIDSIDDLIAKSELFSDFKAVKEGNVWCTGRDLYQATDAVASLIVDFNNIVNGDDGSHTTFIHKVK